MSYEIAFYLLFLALAVAVLIRSGVYIVHALVGIAHFLNISEFTLSFILMAIATSLPELGVGINAALSGNPIISLGNIIGANIVVLSLVLGLILVFVGKMKVNSDISAKAHWFNFALAISPFPLLYDGVLSRFDGAFLMALFAVNVTVLMRARALHPSEPHVWESLLRHFSRAQQHGLAFHGFIKDILVFTVAMGFLLGSSFFVVYAAEHISFAFDISPLFVGIFIVAIGTTLPELTFGVKAALSHHGELSLGNLFGTVVFNSTWILGMVALLQPIVVSDHFSFWISAAYMALVVLCAHVFLRTGYALTRKEGVFLILLYFFFVFIQFRFL